MLSINFSTYSLYVRLRILIIFSIELHVAPNFHSSKLWLIYHLVARRTFPGTIFLLCDFNLDGLHGYGVIRLCPPVLWTLKMKHCWTICTFWNSRNVIIFLITMTITSSLWWWAWWFLCFARWFYIGKDWYIYNHSNTEYAEDNKSSCAMSFYFWGTLNNGHPQIWGTFRMRKNNGFPQQMFFRRKFLRSWEFADASACNGKSRSCYY